MEIAMAKLTKAAVVEQVLDELDGSDFLLLEGDGTVHGDDGYPALALIGRCLAESEGYYLDDQGGWTETQLPTSSPVPAQTERILKRITKAQTAGVTLVLCFHVPGDPRWRLVWTGGHDARSAAQDMMHACTDS
jgi:hypothetical protein